MNKLISYAKLTRLDKPIGIFLLLWPTLIALWIAGDGKPDPVIVSIFIAGVIVMRSAGCVINDIVDRGFDRFVARTKDRPIASGAVTLREGWWLSAGLLGIAGWLALQLNAATLAFSVVGVLLASLYPFMKRYTHFPQIILGAAFGWAIPMAFSALNQPISVEAWMLYGATVLWAMAYDTEYAMADRADDLCIGVKSMAVFCGRWDKVVIGVCQAAALGLFVVLGQRLAVGNVYYGGVILAGGSALYQQYLIQEREPHRCVRAFLNNHFFGLFLWLGLLFSFLNG